MPAVLEILFVEPHAVHDDRELARDGNTGLLHTNPFAELEAHARNDDHFLEIRKWEFAAS